MSDLHYTKKWHFWHYAKEVYALWSRHIYLSYHAIQLAPNYYCNGTKNPPGKTPASSTSNDSPS